MILCLLCLYQKAPHLNLKTALSPQIHFTNQALDNQRFFCIHLLHLLHSVVLCMMAILSALCALSTVKHLPSFLCWVTEGILIAPFHPQKKKRNNKQQVIYLYGQNDLMLFLVDRLIWPELHSIDKTVKECHSSTT